ARIYKELQAKIKLRSVYTHPTVAALSQAVADAEQVRYQDIRPVPEKQHYPLSSAQRRLWILDQFEDIRNTYNMPGAYVFEGEVNAEAFDKAFETLVRRHESLRTTFIVVQGEPRQKIHSFESSGFRVLHLDLRHVPDNEREMQRIVSETAAVVFDLEKGPLVAVKLLRLSESRYACLITLHHIISDAWSKQVLIKEIMTLYAAYSAGQVAALPPLRIQYKDYAAWHNDQLVDGGLSRHRAYWLGKLDQYAVLELPADYPRPALKTYNGHGVDFVVDASWGGPLSKIGQAHGASLFVTLLASVSILLGKYAGQEDMVLGTPVAGRDHPDLEDQIGFYVNSLPLRIQFAPDDSFVQVLEKVKDVTLEAYEHQAYPFDRLVDDLDIDRERSRHPLFDVMVQLENVNQEDRGGEMRGVTVGGLEIEMTSCKYDLVIDFSEAGGWISGSIRYNTDLFTKGSMTRMGGHFTRLIQNIVTNPALPIGELSMYDAEETGMHHLWQSALRPDGRAIGYNAHFFESGGDEAKANSLCSAINQRYGLKLTAGDIHLYPVFRRLLTHVQRCRAAQAQPAAPAGIASRRR
ncbi:MAG: hypothetical protein ICV83_32750, partial [Cytophagales bacterium]|nr:hypothetical protein [Cytophagales bacterium]